MAPACHQYIWALAEKKNDRFFFSAFLFSAIYGDPEV
jgi:hypothetical protein